MAGGAAVKVGSGVSVGGSGVEVASPAGTVSVGAGVFVIVDVGGNVQVGWAGVAVGGCDWLAMPRIAKTATIKRTRAMGRT